MERTAWHDLTTEETLDPGLPICDPHHHLWHGGPRNRERYLLDELLRDLGSGHNIVSTVFMDCVSMYRKDGPVEMRPIGETEFVNGVAAMSASGQYGPTRIAAGIVSWADLKLGAAVAPVLEAHIAASSRFRGVRYATTWDGNPAETQVFAPAPKGLLFDRTFREGLACLERYKLSYDAWMLFHQLTDLVELARAMPGLNIILGHIGGLVGIGPYASRHDEVFQTWKRNVADVAKCPNVTIKIGGIGMPRHGFGWHERDKPPSSAEMAKVFEPYYAHCIEQYGAERCMFESNYPVDGVSASYHLIWNTFKRLAKDCSASERAALFHDTATRVYRLGGN